LKPRSSITMDKVLAMEALLLRIVGPCELASLHQCCCVSRFWRRAVVGDEKLWQRHCEQRWSPALFRKFPHSSARRIWIARTVCGSHCRTKDFDGIALRVLRLEDPTSHTEPRKPETGQVSLELPRKAWSQTLIPHLICPTFLPALAPPL
jgi:hypothetical protein